MTPDLTTVYLSPHDATLFVEFQKRYAMVKLLDSLGVFGIRSGSVTLHFTATGEIGSVDKLQHFRI